MTSRKVIENSPYNKKSLDQQNLNKEESKNLNQKESSETKFNQIFVFFYPRRGGWSITSKIEKTTRKINEDKNSRLVGETSTSKDKSINTPIQKVENIENKETNKIGNNTST